MGHEKLARVKANNMRSRTASEGGGEILTARLLTDCSITQRNILTPERISQGHVQTGGGLLFRGPLCIFSPHLPMILICKIGQFTLICFLKCRAVRTVKRYRPLLDTHPPLPSIVRVTVQLKVIYTIE
jgi:hypothetical protein